MVYTDAFIDYLIACPKIVVDSPKDVKSSRSGSTKRTFTLSSADMAHSFYGFITQNSFFGENFSIGLAYNPKDEKGVIVLLRVNGAHGGTELFPHHAKPHIHKATADRINVGLKPEGLIIETDKYITIEDAIQFYVEMINLDSSDKRKHFPPPNNQLPLFEAGL